MQPYLMQLTFSLVSLKNGELVQLALCLFWTLCSFKPNLNFCHHVKPVSLMLAFKAVNAC